VHYSLHQRESPRAFVCVEGKIFDVSEWATCQVSGPFCVLMFDSLIAVDLFPWITLLLVHASRIQQYLVYVNLYGELVCVILFHSYFHRVETVIRMTHHADWTSFRILDMQSNSVLIICCKCLYFIGNTVLANLLWPKVKLEPSTLKLRPTGFLFRTSPDHPSTWIES